MKKIALFIVISAFAIFAAANSAPKAKPVKGYVASLNALVLGQDGRINKAEAKKLIQDASAEIERKNQEAFNNLKTQIAEIAVGAAEKIIREKLDEQTNAKLVEKYIEDIAKG